MVFARKISRNNERKIIQYEHMKREIIF